MANNFYKPQSPLELDGNYIYPLTTIDQVIMEDGQRLSSMGVVYLDNLNESDNISYLKPQYPLKKQNNYLYPQTTADQVLLSDGSKLEQNGQVLADKIKQSQVIALTGDVVGSASFDGSAGIAINTAVSASQYYTATLSASGWSSSIPYTQTVTVNGIRSSHNPIVDLNMSNATGTNGTLMSGSWGLVGRITTNNNSITAYCYEEKPEIDLSINLMVVK